MIIEWFKNLFYVVKNYKDDYSTMINDFNYVHEQMSWHHKEIKDATNLIKERTEISTDIHLRGHDRNQIIVVGRYRKQDYVQVFTTNDNDMNNLINQLRDMQQYGVVEKIDAAPSVKFIINRELEF